MRKTGERSRRPSPFRGATVFFSAFSRAWAARAARRISSWSCIPTPICRTRCACGTMLRDVRLSDILREAPVPVIEAAAAILLGQMYRRRVPGELRDLYRAVRAGAFHAPPHCARPPQTRAPHRARPGGAAHDLAPMFAAINPEYFDGSLRRPRLGWSARPWRSQFGCFDPSLNQIVMNSGWIIPKCPPTPWNSSCITRCST